MSEHKIVCITSTEDLLHRINTKVEWLIQKVDRIEATLDRVFPKEHCACCVARKLEEDEE